jgi:HD-GYP domain-containing protein (c-di-GMP phosphodiesterase class II)
VRKINPELWLLLFLVVIAAMLNFLVASQRMALVFYFLPTLFSAFYFGRRHATLTALASVVLVVLLTYANPMMFRGRVELPFDPRWFDLTVWGGVLMVAGYVTGTLYERNQQSLREMEDGYEGMLAILQNFLANQKYSEAHAYRISMCATKVAETLGLDSGSLEDLRTAALLFNLKELGITNEVLYKAAQVSHEDLTRGRHHRKRPASKANALGSSLRRAIPIFLTERHLRQSGGKVNETSFEVQILGLAEEYEALISGQNGTRMSPSQAVQEVVRRSSGRYDSLVLNAFSKAFGGQAAGAGA